MDGNISNVTANADDTANADGVTMYLSFDADNTLSSTAFQTLENTIEQDENKNVAGISPLINKTLESNNNLLSDAGSSIGVGNNTDISGAQAQIIKAMQSMSINNKKQTPIRALPKNVLKEFNAKSSTPTNINVQVKTKLDISSKEEKIIVPENSGAVDLSLVFNKMEAVKSFGHGIDAIGEEQKENSQVDISNASTLSISSMLERKIVMLSTTEEDSSIVELKTNNNAKEMLCDATAQFKDKIKCKNIQNVNFYNNEKVAKDIFARNDKSEQSDEVVGMLNKEHVEQLDAVERNNEPVVVNSDTNGKPVLEKGKSSEKILKLVKEQDKENKQPSIKFNKMHEKQTINTIKNQNRNNDLATVVPTKMNNEKDVVQLVKQQSCDKYKQESYKAQNQQKKEASKVAEEQRKYKQNKKVINALEEKHEKPVAVAAENAAAIKLDINKENAEKTVEAQNELDTAAVVQILINDVKKDLPKIVVSDLSDTEDKAAIKQPTKFVNDKSKLRRSLIPAKNIPKSFCEPDLKTNRPSRIANKRISLMPSMSLKTIIEQNSNISDFELKKSDEQPTTSMAAKISNDVQLKKSIINDVKKQTSVTAIKMSETLLKKPISCNEVDKPTINTAQQNKRKSVAMATKATNTRASLLPTTNQHLLPSLNVHAHRSALFTNAANSPARKILRRSIMAINASPLTKSRRSILATTNATSKRRSVVTFEKPLTATTKDVMQNKRKSLHPTALFRGNTTTNIQKSHAKLIATLSAPANLQLNAATGAIKKEKTFTCHICTAKFRIKSLLDAHKRSHEDVLTVAVTKKPTTTIATINNNAQNVQNSYIGSCLNQCKYCDKKFALLRALHIHLMVNCPKIPPKEKRKLDFTEMDHVEKAQLPHFINTTTNSNENSSHANSNSSSLISLTSSTGAQQEDTLLQKLRTSNLSSAAASEDESLIEKSEVTVIVNEISALFNKTMAPPTTNKVKRSKIPGMFGTPKKTIKCHLCNECFINVLDYTDHSMSKHSTVATIEKNAQTIDKNENDKLEIEFVDDNKNSTTEV